MQAFGLIWLFPLTFVSSAFVPIQSMPGWLQAFANHQPVTVRGQHHARARPGRALCNLRRTCGRASPGWPGIFIVFVPLAIRAYKRAA